MGSGRPARVLTVVGARPQFVKAATVSRAIAKRSDLEEILVHTGQHYDALMSEIFLRDLEMIEPRYNLGIKGGSHGATTGRMLEAIEHVLEIEKPDGVIIYGDTTSTLAGGLAAVKLHIPLFHVEAGLRVYDLTVPEEVNRLVVDHVSSILFVPSRRAIENLSREGLGHRATFSGDVMYDSVRFYEDRFARQRSMFFGDVPFVFMTMHREENTRSPERMRCIMDAVAHIGIPVLFPMHPRTVNFVRENAISLPDVLRVIDPLGYFETLSEVSASLMVMTDSGGLQKEAFFMGKHAIVLLDSTPWHELVELGTNAVVGADRDAILAAFTRFAASPATPDASPYGAGNAAEIICEHVAGALRG